MVVYDDEENARALYRLFIFFQYLMVLIVYTLAYTAWVAVSVQVAKNGLTVMAYLPVMLVVIGFPIALYKTRKRFHSEKRLSAVAWVMGWASVMVVGLYYHVSKLTGV